MTTKSNLDFLMRGIKKDLPKLPLSILNEINKRMCQLTQCEQENWYFQNLNFYSPSEKLDFLRSDLRNTTGFSFAGFYGIDASQHAFYHQFGDRLYMCTIALPSDDLGKRILYAFAEKDEREVILVHTVLFPHGINMEKILLAEKPRLTAAKEFISEYVTEAMIDTDVQEFKIIGKDKSAI
jgi:hypothetical protein